MERLKIKCISKPSSLLLYVKAIKKHTGMGLKESKEFCERSIQYLGQEFDLSVTTSSDSLNKEINELLGADQVIVSNTQRDRQMKLLSLGLGDSSDLIDLLADNLASELITMTNRHGTAAPSNYSVYIDFISDILINFTPEQLNELFIKKIKEKQ
jgi:hypothetical protein